MEQPYSKLPPGPWRGVLKLDPRKELVQNTPRETPVQADLDFEEVTEGDLPFNFEISYLTPDSLHMHLRNREQVIEITDISFKHDRATNKDTVLIKFPESDAMLKALFEDNVMEGYYTSSPADLYPVSFVARHGQDHRFTLLKKEPISDFTGQWQMEFRKDDEEILGNMLLNQLGNDLRGSLQFGDVQYAHLEGTVQDDKIYLSAFDGKKFLLIEGKASSSSEIDGVMRNSTQHFITWHATK
ncbi:MAG: hypothetical protein HKN87_00750 [Saprospiraceae bacterium]|nr:hypothetical protein [Saprospiraceae bacterium]